MAEEVELIKSPEPNKTEFFVKVRADGEVIRYELPIEKHFNDGSGVAWWKTRGLLTEQEYEFKKHEKEVAERIAAAEAKAAELEAANKVAEATATAPEVADKPAEHSEKKKK